jgi:hypothetical protein
LGHQRTSANCAAQNKDRAAAIFQNLNSMLFQSSWFGMAQSALMAQGD